MQLLGCALWSKPIGEASGCGLDRSGFDSHRPPLNERTGMNEDESIDYDELLEAASATELADASSIKAALPVAFVLHQYGVEVEEGDTGGLSAFCPFHEDRNRPAFTVFGDNLDRWGCWACGINGDVLDLIAKFNEHENGSNLLFPEQCDAARLLISQLDDSDWTGPVKGKKRHTLDSAQVIKIVDRSQSEPDIDRINMLLLKKRKQDGIDSNRFTADWLMREFNIGTWGDWIVLPYYDSEHELVTYKWRTLDQKPRAAAGSSFDNLYYNGWRTDMLDAPILLCEGESDTWNAQYEVGDTYRVLGVATGVMTRIQRPEIFRDKDVFIAFDADKAGREGIERWSKMLTEAGANARIVPLPPGKDVSAVAASMRSVVQRARPLVARPDGIRETEKGYVRANSKAADPISNFVFVPTRELIGAEAIAYEITLKPGGDRTIIASFDLQGKNKIVSWALKNGRSWYGSDRDAQILLGMLQADGVYLPAGRMTTVAGLHDNHFVWPGGTIGADYWKYIPPPADAHLEETIRIKPGSWQPDYIHVLRSIHKRRIMDPLLAWLAVAPLRSLFKEFPILAVSGPHGSGKTRTVETTVRSFTGSYNANTLTGSTPHSIMAGVSATNAFPMIWDEYRTGARDDSRKVFEQVLRDAYTQQKSQRGGGVGNWAELVSIPTSAPIIVSGEDMFSEGSHVERMIMLQMYRDGQNPEAFGKANSWIHNGFPYAYLTWLHRSLIDGTFDNLKVEPAGPSDLSSRQRINIGIITLGWRLLQMFMEDADESLSEPDFTHVVTELREANGHTPIEDAIHWCLGELEAANFCHVKDGQILVRVENFVKFINDPRNGNMFQLPGRAPAVKKYLIMKFGAVDIVKQTGSLKQEFLSFPYSKIAR